MASVKSTRYSAKALKLAVKLYLKSAGFYLHQVEAWGIEVFDDRAARIWIDLKDETIDSVTIVL